MDSLPKISIITPCLNQSKYVESTIRSIHEQAYPELEHIVMDGVSSDGSLEIIKRYSDRLQWVSEPDDGQYHAIQKGFSIASGEVMGWLNSDDIYLPGTLRTVGEIFRDFPDVEWLTTLFPMGIDKNGALIKINSFPGFSYRNYLRGDYLPACGWDALGFIQQESTFWRRSLWERAGGVFTPGLDYAGDFDLWGRFFEHSNLYGVDVPLGCFRKHDGQKTSVAFDRYLTEAKMAFSTRGGSVLPRQIQRVRIGLLKLLGNTTYSRPFAKRIGLLNVHNITYDWARARWAKEA